MTGGKVLKQTYNTYKQTKKVEGYIKDIGSLLREPNKGNAIRIISKRSLSYIYKVGGGPGTMIKALYGPIIDHLIDALYYVDRANTIEEKLDALVKTGEKVKPASLRGIRDLLRENEFSKERYMPSVWQYCFLLGVTDPQNNKQYPKNLELQLIQKTKNRVKAFDKDIILFLAVDKFVQSIPRSIERLRSELKKPKNIIEGGVEVLAKKLINSAELSSSKNNFSSGILPAVNSYINLRNKWALWINLDVMTIERYEIGMLPDIYFD